MAKQKEANASAGVSMPVEKLAQLEQTPLYLLAGVKAANGWGAGKELTQEEYQKAVESFLTGPMTGRS